MLFIASSKNLNGLKFKFGEGTETSKNRSFIHAFLSQLVNFFFKFKSVIKKYSVTSAIKKH